MKLDMTPLLNGDAHETGFCYELDFVPDGSVSDITVAAPVRVEGSVTNRAGCIELSLTATVEFQTRCARCLRELDRTITVGLKCGVARKGSLEDEDNPDYLFISDGKLDIDTPVTEQLYMELPSKVLCKDDCLGLCPVCGADLNLQKCGCETRQPDPRLAVLKKLLEKD